MELPQEFLSCFSQAVQDAPQVLASFTQALDEETSPCIRYNPIKSEKITPVAEAVAIPWARWGRRLNERPCFTLDPLFHAGAYYVQDASSMFVGEVFRWVLQQETVKQKAALRPLRVLDLCAAPGGKTTDMAASLRQAFGGNFLLVANEVMPQRAGVLKDNVAIWGDPNVVVTSSMPVAFSSLHNFFDIVLVDAPCSGEGMFRKEPQALAQWSIKGVEECAARQKSILDDIYPALAEDAYLLYSTCTYNRLENEEVVEHFMAAHAYERVDLQTQLQALIQCSADAGEQLLCQDGMVRLIPGLVHGEGQFCALLRAPEMTNDSPRTATHSSDNIQVEIETQDEMKIALPAAIAPEVNTLKRRLKMIGSGVKLGESKGKNWSPAEDFALSLLYGVSCEKLQDFCQYPQVEVEAETALKYLHGDSFPLPDAPQGVVVLSYQGCLLGFVKNLGSRCNNPRPKSRRIKMDIK